MWFLKCTHSSLTGLLIYNIMMIIYCKWNPLFVYLLKVNMHVNVLQLHFWEVLLAGAVWETCAFITLSHSSFPRLFLVLWVSGRRTLVFILCRCLRAHVRSSRSFWCPAPPDCLHSCAAWTHIRSYTAPTTRMPKHVTASSLYFFMWRALFQNAINPF